MDKTDIKYTTPEQQIEKLKEQHLSIPSDADAKYDLEIYGYSNLIKSYREPYTIVSNNEKIYLSGITFNRITSLYCLDKAFRNSVMAAMQDLEEHIKECTADVVAKSFGTHQDDYLNSKNYRDKRRRNPRFSLSNILNTMRSKLNTDKNPIKHYSDKYGVVPPWILFKSVYFSTIVNFISLLKNEEQEELVKKLYGPNYRNLPMESFRMLMMDTLFICNDYRNMSAHGGRIYNYITDKNLRSKEIFNEEHVGGYGFGQLLFLLSLFKYRAPYYRLLNTLEDEITRHCSSYPQDETYLAQILQVDIEKRRVVYISDNSKIYHNAPYCSGAKKRMQINFDELDLNVYTPCKRCVKS